MPDDSWPALAARDLHLRYPRGPQALAGVSLQVARAEIVAVLGPNGSGKSTLLRCLAGLLRPDSGAVTVNGAPVRELAPAERARRIALLPQILETLPGVSALEFAMMGRYPHLAGWRLFSKKDEAIALAALQSVDALGYKDRALDQMSGGERQRVVLARALAQESPIILLDEPTSALDLKHQIMLYRLLLQMREKDRKTILVATHDLNLASQFSDRVLLMKGGRIAAEGPPAETLTPVILQDVYETELAHGLFASTIDGKPRPWVLPCAR